LFNDAVCSSDFTVCPEIRLGMRLSGDHEIAVSLDKISANAVFTGNCTHLQNYTKSHSGRHRRTSNPNVKSIGTVIH
jgi:hypothetical protein